MMPALKSKAFRPRDDQAVFGEIVEKAAVRIDEDEEAKMTAEITVGV